MYCRKCGTEIVAEGKFCHKCGYPVDFIPAPVKKKAFNAQRYVISMRIAIALMVLTFIYMLFGSDTGTLMCVFPMIILTTFITAQRGKAIRYGVTMDNPDEIDIKTRGEQNSLMRKQALLMLGLLILSATIVVFKLGGN